ALIDRLAALADDGERRALIAAQPALRSPELLNALTTRVLRQIRVSTADALRLADCAITIAESLGTPAARAEALRCKANALYGAGQNNPAIELHQQAAQLFEESGDRDQLTR